MKKKALDLDSKDLYNKVLKWFLIPLIIIYCLNAITRESVVTQNSDGTYKSIAKDSGISPFLYEMHILNES